MSPPCLHDVDDLGVDRGGVRLASRRLRPRRTPRAHRGTRWKNQQMTENTSTATDTPTGTSSSTVSPAPQAGTQPALWVERTGGRRYVGRSARGGEVQLGGLDVEGTFTPGELLKIALAACTGFSSDVTLARRLGDDYAATIHVSGVSDPDEDRYPRLVERLELDLSGLDDEARERLLTVVTRAVDQACTVGRTLKAGADVDLTIASVSTAE